MLWQRSAATLGMVALLATVWAPRAGAQSAFDEERAAQALAEAQELADAGRYAEAIVQLEPFDHPDHPVFPLLIARYSDSAGDYVRSEALFRQLLEGEYGALTDDFRDEAAAGLARVSERVATLRVHVSRASGVLPPNAELTIDGAVELLEDGHARRRLNPGSHYVQVSAPDHERTRREIRLDLGEQRDLELELIVRVTVDVPAGEVPTDVAETEECPRECRRRRRLGWGISAAAVAVGATVFVILISGPDRVKHPVWDQTSALVTW